MQLDRIDLAILDLLQKDGQLTNQELADKVSLSPSPCLRRVKRLEEMGYIEKYVALLNPAKLNLSLMILASVGLDNHSAVKMQQFEETIQTYPEVVTCYLIAGQAADYFLKIVTKDLESYQNFLTKKLLTINGVSNVHSSFILQKIVEKTELPLVS